MVHTSVQGMGISQFPEGPRAMLATYRKNRLYLFYRWAPSHLPEKGCGLHVRPLARAETRSSEAESPPEVRSGEAEIRPAELEVRPSALRAVVIDLLAGLGPSWAVKSFFRMD